MGLITSAIAAAAVSAAAQSGPLAPDTVVVQPTYITAAARLAPADGSPVTTHTNAYARGEAVAREKPELAVVTIRGLTPWEPRVDVVINPWVRQDGPIFDNFREYGANDGPYLGTNPATRAIEKTQERLERARQQWLRDNGWVGGVATHVNPAPAGEGSAEAPKPRATIRMPAGSSGGGNFRVQADPDQGAAARDALARIEARRQTLAQAARAQRSEQRENVASAEATPAASDRTDRAENRHQAALSEEAQTAQASDQR